MSDIFELFKNPTMFHALLKILGSYLVFMAITSALPLPKPDSSALYSFVFHFCNTLSANVGRVFYALKVPGIKQPVDDSQPQPKP